MKIFLQNFVAVSADQIATGCVQQKGVDYHGLEFIRTMTSVTIVMNWLILLDQLRVSFPLRNT